MNKEPKYVAKRTMLSQRFVGSIFVAIVGIALAIALAVITKSFGVASLVALGIAVIGALVALIEGLRRNACRVEFYDNKYVIKSGLIAKQENQMAFTKIMSVSVDKSFLGAIFNYGNVKIDIVGKNDSILGGVKNPNGLKNYLENLIANPDTDVKQVITD